MKKIMVIMVMLAGTSAFAQQQLHVYLYQKLSIYEPEYDTKTVATAYAVMGCLFSQAMNSGPEAYISKNFQTLLDKQTSRDSVEPFLKSISALIEPGEFDNNLLLAVWASTINTSITEVRAAYQIYYLLKSELWR